MKRPQLMLAITGVLSIPAMANDDSIVLPQGEVLSAEVMKDTSGGLVFANGFDLSAGPIVSIGDFFQFPSAFFVSDDLYTELEVVELTEVLTDSVVSLVDVGATGIGDLLNSTGDFIGEFIGGYIGGIPAIPFL